MLKNRLKMKRFSDIPRNLVFANGAPKCTKMSLQNKSHMKLFLEMIETRESRSRQHTVLVFEVLSIPKSHIFRFMFVTFLGAALEPLFSKNKDMKD